MVSNTFALPAAGKSLTLSRTDWNEYLRSVTSHAYGSVIPSANEFTDEGTSVNPYTGFIYRSSTFNALYIYDSTRAKGGGLGSGYTRVGIGHRNFESITDLVANLQYVEQSELCTVVGDSTANYRLYMKTNNSNAIVDVGLPPSSSLATSMFIDRQISNVRLIANTITHYEIAHGTIIGDKLADRTLSNLKIAANTITRYEIQNTANVVLGNVTAVDSNFGVKFGDGTRQTTAYTGTSGAWATHYTFNDNAVSSVTSDSISASYNVLRIHLLVTGASTTGAVRIQLRKGAGTNITAGVYEYSENANGTTADPSPTNGSGVHVLTPAISSTANHGLVIELEIVGLQEGVYKYGTWRAGGHQGGGTAFVRWGSFTIEDTTAITGFTISMSSGTAYFRGKALVA